MKEAFPFLSNTFTWKARVLRWYEGLGLWKHEMVDTSNTQYSLAVKDWFKWNLSYETVEACYLVTSMDCGLAILYTLDQDGNKTAALWAPFKLAFSTHTMETCLLKIFYACVDAVPHVLSSICCLWTWIHTGMKPAQKLRFKRQKIHHVTKVL